MIEQLLQVYLLQQTNHLFLSSLLLSHVIFDCGQTGKQEPFFALGFECPSLSQLYISQTQLVVPFVALQGFLCDGDLFGHEVCQPAFLLQIDQFEPLLRVACIFGHFFHKLSVFLEK